MKRCPQHQDRLGDGGLFGFLTTEPNAEVGAVHHKAMPVVLTTADEWDLSMNGSWEEAKALQPPLPDEALEIIDQRKPGAAE